MRKLATSTDVNIKNIARVRLAMATIEITGASLAEWLMVSVSTVSNWLRNETDVPYSVVLFLEEKAGQVASLPKNRKAKPRGNTQKLVELNEQRRKYAKVSTDDKRDDYAQDTFDDV